MEVDVERAALGERRPLAAAVLVAVHPEPVIAAAAVALDVEAAAGQRHGADARAGRDAVVAVEVVVVAVRVAGRLDAVEARGESVRAAGQLLGDGAGPGRDGALEAALHHRVVGVEGDVERRGLRHGRPAGAAVLLPRHLEPVVPAGGRAFYIESRALEREDPDTLASRQRVRAVVVVAVVGGMVRRADGVAALGKSVTAARQVRVG